MRPVAGPQRVKQAMDTINPKPDHARLPQRNEPLSTRVITLHASGGSSRQWRELPSALGDDWVVECHDHIDHGRGSPWSRPGQPALADHVEALRPLLLGPTQPAHLVAHSFGAVVALQAALEHPQAVCSLALYEPVLVALLTRRAQSLEPEQQVFRIADFVRELVAKGDPMGAARCFVSYWSGIGAWAELDATARTTAASRMSAVAGHFDVIEAAAPLVRRLNELRTPVLLISGDRTTAAARRVVERLARHLPQTHFKVIPGAGHMGPVTHTQQVNRRIANFLLMLQHFGPAQLSSPWPVPAA